jgi:hypothetical protein
MSLEVQVDCKQAFRHLTTIVNALNKIQFCALELNFYSENISKQIVGLRNSVYKAFDEKIRTMPPSSMHISNDVFPYVDIEEPFFG